MRQHKDKLRILLTTTGLLVAALQSTSCDEEVRSCSLNQSTTKPWLCTEGGGDGECSATAPNIVVEGDGCPDGASGRCETSSGKFFYYNETQESLAEKKNGCINTLNGTWSE